MPFRTRLTELLGIEHPVLLAPMGLVSGGALAAAVSSVGGLGLIGLGYGDPEWLERELRPPALPGSAVASSPGRLRAGRSCSSVPSRTDPRPSCSPLAIRPHSRA